MRRNRDDEPTPGSKWAILATLNEMQAEARAERERTRAAMSVLFARVAFLTRLQLSLSAKLRADLSAGFSGLQETLNTQGDDEMVVYADILAAVEQNESTAGSVRDAIVALRGELEAAKVALDNGSDAELQALLDRMANADAMTKQVLSNTPAASEPIPPAEPTPEPAPVEQPAPDPVAEQPAPPAEVPAEVPAEGSEPVAEQPATDPNAPQQ